MAFQFLQRQNFLLLFSHFTMSLFFLWAASLQVRYSNKVNCGNLTSPNFDFQTNDPDSVFWITIYVVASCT